MKKIYLLISFMLIMTVAGSHLSSMIYGFKSQSYGTTGALIAGNIHFLIFINFLMYLLDMLRMRIIGTIFNLKFSLGDCFGGVALNLFFGWISPMAILGAPAMAYYLCKRGYTVVDSLSVSFVRSFLIILTSALTTVTIYSLGLQGQIQNPILQEKVFQVLMLIAIYIFALGILSYLPFEFIRKNRFLASLTTQIRLLLSNGKWQILPIMLISLVLNFLLVSFIYFEGRMIAGDSSAFLGQVMIFLSYMLLMPTPGASGLAEVGAPLIFGNLFPKDILVSLVSAARFSSIGIQVGIGFVYMFFILKQTFTLEDLREFRKSRSP